MPSKSPAQARLMAAAAHDATFAHKVGVPQSVAKEFNKADKGSGITRTATRDYDRSEDEHKSMIHDGSTEAGMSKTAQWIRNRSMRERRNASGWE